MPLYYTVLSKTKVGLKHLGQKRVTPLKLFEKEEKKEKIEQRLSTYSKQHLCKTLYIAYTEKAVGVRNVALLGNCRLNK